MFKRCNTALVILLLVGMSYAVVPTIIPVGPRSNELGIAVTKDIVFKLFDVAGSNYSVKVNGVDAVIYGRPVNGFHYGSVVSGTGVQINVAHPTFNYSSVNSVDISAYDATNTLGQLSYSFTTAALPVALADTVAPLISPQYPTTGLTDVSTASSVYIEFWDGYSGVDLTQLNVMIGGVNAVVNGIAQTGYGLTTVVSTNGQTKTATITHPAWWYATDYTIYTTIKDVSGNATWSNTTFKTQTESDITAPLLSPQYPTNGLMTVNITSPVSIDLWDRQSGVDLTQLNVMIGGVNAVVNGVAQTGYGLTTVVSTNGQTKTATITHPAWWYATDYTMYTTIKDVSGNASSNTISFKTQSQPDYTAPLISPQYPLNSATSVNAASPIFINLWDGQSGVSLNSLLVMLNGVNAIVSGAAQVGYGLSTSINGQNIALTITHPTWNSLTSYTMYTNVADVSGNVTGNTITFTTTVAPVVIIPTDNVPPSIINESPVSGSINVPTNSAIVFDITDAISGVSINALYLKLNSVVTVAQGKVVTPSLYILTTTNITGGVHFSIQPQTHFAYATQYFINIDVADVSNNWQTRSYSFTTTAAPVVVVVPTDNAPPVLTPLSPQPGDTTVLTGSKISFILSDAFSGISLNTLSVAVNNIPVKINGNLLYDQYAAQVFSGVTPTAAVSVLIDHATTFNYATLYTVTITCRDVSGNLLVTDYSFTTQPTPSIGVSDNIPPVLTLISPTSNAVGCGLRDQIVFTVSDNAGVAFNTLKVILNATRRLIDNGFPLEPIVSTFNGTSVMVTINPSISLNYGVTNTIEIVVADINGNTTTLSRTFVTMLGAPSIAASGSALSETTINTRVVNVYGTSIPNAKIYIYSTAVSSSIAQTTADWAGGYAITVLLPTAGYQKVYAVAEDPVNRNHSESSRLCGFNPNNKQLRIMTILGSMRGRVSADVLVPVEALPYDVESVVLTPVTRNVFDSQYLKQILPFQLDLKPTGVSTTLSAVSFAAPLTITLNFETAISKNQLATIAVYYNNNGMWKKDGIQVLAVSSNSVVFTTTHFTEFSIVDTAALTVALNNIGTYVAPNPVNFSKDNVHFIYDMGDRERGTVQIRVYDIAGSLLWKHSEEVRQSQGTIVWNGLTDDGRVLANGPYLAFVIMTDGSWKKIQRLPLAVLK